MALSLFLSSANLIHKWCSSSFWLPVFLPNSYAPDSEFSFKGIPDILLLGQFKFYTKPAMGHCVPCHPLTLVKPILAVDLLDHFWSWQSQNFAPENQTPEWKLESIWRSWAVRQSEQWTQASQWSSLWRKGTWPLEPKPTCSCMQRSLYSVINPDTMVKAGL